MSLKELRKKNPTLHVVGTVALAAILITVGVYIYENNLAVPDNNSPVASPQNVLDKARAGQVMEYEFNNGVLSAYYKNTYTEKAGQSINVKQYVKAYAGGVKIIEGEFEDQFDAEWANGFKFLGNDTKPVLGKNVNVALWENSETRIYISADGLICLLGMEDDAQNWDYIPLKSKNF